MASTAKAVQSSSGEKQTATAARFPETQRGKRIEIHHEIVAMSIQPCSKASNESANPDNAIIRIMRKSSEIDRNEADIITGRNKKVQTRTVVLSNVNVPSYCFPINRGNRSETVVDSEEGRPVKST